MGELAQPTELTEFEMETVAGGITVSNTGVTTSGFSFSTAGMTIDARGNVVSTSVGQFGTYTSSS